MAGILGGAGFLSGLRALLRGERSRGLVRLAFGGIFLAAALAQRRSREESDVEETDLVDTGSDIEAVTGEAGGVGEEDHATGQAAPEITDIGSDETATEADTESEASIQIDDVDRLGEAAFDRQTREVPVPQRAFNQAFLSHSAEAFWGVRAGDDAVLVSQDFDAIEGRDGVKYVASSKIDEDVRELPIPTAVLNHWDEVGGGGTAVAGGDDILFVTTDDLEADHLLRVLPAEWADDLSE